MYYNYIKIKKGAQKMRYHIKYKCGHEENVNLTGKQNSQSYADWLAAGVCKECYHAQKAAEVENYAKAEGLSELTGTERQIEWAKKIRYELYKDIKRFLSYCEENEYKTLFEQWIKSQSEARFWIDNRFNEPDDVITYWEREVMGYGK